MKRLLRCSRKNDEKETKEFVTLKVFFIGNEKGEESEFRFFTQIVQHISIFA